MSYQIFLCALSLLLAPISLLATGAMGIYVGELQEKWRFPSDHLPIGMTFEDLHVLSWNVLDARYMNWVIKKNSQGLKRSLIAEEHVYIKDSKLTIRDRHVIDLLLQTLSHPTHPRSILSLQECGEPFLEELCLRLPTYFEVIAHHGNAIILDKNHFTLVKAKEVCGIFAEDANRTFQEIHVRRLSNGETMRIINAHLPGDPTKPSHFEFTDYLSRTFNPTLTTFVMGDMNFNELEMSDALSHAFANHSPFSLHTPYPTDISPYVFKSKAIDHFLVYSPAKSAVVLNSADQIMPELSPMVRLLQEVYQ